MPKYDNSERLSTVSDQYWCEALDELTTSPEGTNQVWRA